MIARYTPKKLIAGLCLLIATLLGATSAMADRINIAKADWTGPVIVCGLLERIMVDEMGLRVKRTALPVGPITHEAVVAGDIDIGCEDWPSYNQTKEKYIKKFGGDGSEAYLGEVGNRGNTGYYVPRYLVEGGKAKAPGLKSYKDLNKYKDLFKGLDTGSKGRLIGCPVANWACDDQKRLDALGVDFKAVELGSETAHWAELQAAFSRGEAFVAYAWEPHWIHAALDLVEIELPPYDENKWPATDWAYDIPFNYGSTSFVKKHPKAAKLVANMKLTNEEQAKMIYAVDIEQRDADKVIREWMAANPTIWRAWLPK